MLYILLSLNQSIRKPSETSTHHTLNTSSFSPSVWPVIRRKQFIFSSNIFINTFSYILNKQNAVGAHFGKVSTEIDEDNIEKAETMFLGVN